MKKILIVAFLLVLLAVAFVSLLQKQSVEVESAGEMTSAGPVATERSRIPESVIYVEGSEEFTTDLHSTEIAPEDDLLILQQLLYTYRQAFGSNPQGGLNVEIAERLLGRNEKNARFLPDSFPYLNDDGELVDRWGSPYFFHPVSAEIMEIVSAGPDKELWTDDDVTIQ